MKKKIIRGNAPKIQTANDKILAWFFAFPESEFTLNELCKNLAISKTTANSAISAFEKKGFLYHQVLGKVWRIRANAQHIYFSMYKIPFNLKTIYESRILEWIDTRVPGARVVILFGSYRKGDDIDTSDIDIGVEVVQESHPEIIEVLLKQFGYRKNVQVNITLFSRKHIDLNLFASIANGIVLKGFLEVRP